MNRAIFSVAYFGPIHYFSKIISYSDVLIENQENFTKQTYRNRCVILSANGPLTLTIPVLRTGNPKQKTSEIQIDYSKRWQDIHLRALESAYNKSAFFSYYIDEIKDIYQKQIKSLMDFNLRCQELICNCINVKVDYHLTVDYQSNYIDHIDYRDKIHPKTSFFKDDKAFMPMSYYQVFSGKYGFVPNLSILDLLFNMGNESLEILKKSLIEPKSNGEDQTIGF